MDGGATAGPLDTIIAEVMIGLLADDRSSYLSQDHDWELFAMVDLLRFAGVA